MALTESTRDRRPDFPFLEATMNFGEEELEVGESGLGHIQLRNIGVERIEIHSDQPVVATILDRSNKERVGGYTGWIAGTGLVIRLGSDETATIPVLIGTTSRRGDEIVTLPPGDYLIKVDLPILELRPDEDGYERSHLQLPLIPIKFVEKRTN